MFFVHATASSATDLLRSHGINVEKNIRHFQTSSHDKLASLRSKKVYSSNLDESLNVKVGFPSVSMSSHRFRSTNLPETKNKIMIDYHELLEKLQRKYPRAQSCRWIKETGMEGKNINFPFSERVFPGRPPRYTMKFPARAPAYKFITQSFQCTLYSATLECSKFTSSIKSDRG